MLQALLGESMGLGAFKAKPWLVFGLVGHPKGANEGN
jgi:hypothetical protein